MPLPSDCIHIPVFSYRVRLIEFVSGDMINDQPIEPGCYALITYVEPEISNVLHGPLTQGMIKYFESAPVGCAGNLSYQTSG